MDMSVITEFITQVGFPIFVALFMLLKQSKDTEDMTQILTKLQTTIESLANKIDKG